MADMTDKAAGDLQQAGTQMGRSAATASTRAGIKVGKGAFGLGVGVGAGVIYGTVKAILALIESAQQHTATRDRISSPERQVNLREFNQIADGKREFMPVQDAQIARQFSRELRKHGVTFAVEKQPDGSRVFHVQGKDAGVVEHALTVAATKIDEQLAKTRTTGEVLDKADLATPGERVLELDAETKTELASALNDAADKEAPKTARVLSPNEGWEKWQPEVQQLAAKVEEDGRIPLTVANVEILDAALIEHVPTRLAEVRETAAEERNVFAAADDPAASQVQQVELGAVENDVTVVEQPAPVQQSDNPYLQLDKASAPAEESPVVGAADSESVSSESTPSSSEDAPQMDSPEQDVSHGSATAAPAPAPSAGSKNAKATQGQSIAQPKAQGNKTAAQTNSASTAKPQREELGKRDETRKKVAERIDIKVQKIKSDHSASPSKLQAPKPERAPRR